MRCRRAYGLLAESVSHPDDFSSVTYRLRPQAKLHDGKPVTPEDVIFSFNAFKQNNPQLSAYYQHVTKVEKTGEREITFTFDAPGQSRIAADRRRDQRAAQALVRRRRQIRQTSATSRPPRWSLRSATAPTGSRNSCRDVRIVYERVKDYWGKDLPVNIGRDNFDELRYEYFRDTTVALEAFKADQLDWRIENVAQELGDRL